jgi:DNA-binding FadR family transcriptional regulator
LSTIHEAIQVLTAVGLVEAHPGKGTWVRSDVGATLLHPVAVTSRLGELDARQLYEARSVIEVGLVKLAAQRATAEDIQNIQAARRALEAATDQAAFVQADIEYHLAVARAGHSRLLEQFYHVARQLLEQVAAELIALPGVIAESLPLQAAVAQAIEQRDAPKAEQAALAHMRYVEKLLDQYE